MCTQWGILYKSAGNERINNITKYINARAREAFYN